MRDSSTSSRFTANIKSTITPRPVVISILIVLPSILSNRLYELSGVFLEIGKVLSDLKLTGADGANYQFDPAQVTIYADITARNVTLIAASDSKVYDGTPLTNNSYSIGGDGFVAGEGVDTVVVTGSQTRPGASENVITSYTLAQNTEAGNYEITLQSGVLTVYASGYGFVNYDQFPDIMNWNFSAVVPAMLGSALASGNAVVFPEGNLYAAPYSTLVAATETSRSSGGVFSVLDELRNGFGDQGDKFVSSRYQPGEFVMELDQLVRDVGDSVIGSAGKVSNAKALGTGNELFVDDLFVVLEISGNSSSWAAVRRGTFTLGRGLMSLFLPSRDLRRMMAMMRSSDMKNSRSDNTRNASSKRSRCTSVQ